MEKSLGRRKTTGPGVQVVVRIHDPLLADLDRYRESMSDEPSRPEALRQLAAYALQRLELSPKRGRKK